MLNVSLLQYYLSLSWCKVWTFGSTNLLLEFKPVAC